MLASVFGPREHIRQSRATVKIFFSGENTRRFKAYKDHCLKDVDLSLGMEYIDHEKFIRFPLWLTYLFLPTSLKKKFSKRWMISCLAFAQTLPINKNSAH